MTDGKVQLAGVELEAPERRPAPDAAGRGAPPERRR